MDSFNLYEETGLDVKITDVTSVLKAIDDKILWYKQRINIPKFRPIVPVKNKQLADLKEEIKANPGIIVKHATEYAEIARRAAQEAERIIREQGMIYVSNGMIAEANLKQLANQTKMSEAEILRILGAKIKKDKTFNFKDDNVRELDPSTMAKINSALSRLGKKTIYEVLGVSPNASADQLRTAFNKIDAQVKAAGTVISSNVEMQAKHAFVTECFPVINDPEKRKGYDKARDNAGFEPVRNIITQMKAGTKVINSRQYRQMLDLCTKNGIPRDKAEYLVYKTAKASGLEIDEGDASTLVSCRFCGSLNEESSKACSSCGMPVKVVCPKCGRPTGNDDYSCTNCGFSIIGMRDALTKIKVAVAVLNQGDLETATREIEAANALWPNHPDIKATADKIASRSNQIESVRRNVASLCAEKKYYAALSAAQSLGTADMYRSEAQKAVDNAARLVSQADATSDPNARFDLLLKALSTCPDYQPAQSKLDTMSLPVPAGLTAQVRGTTVALSWTPCNSSLLSYMVVRKDGSKPSGPSDGQQIATTKESFYDDTSASPARSYYYAVYSRFGSKTSATGCVTQLPAFIAQPLQPHQIKVNPSDTSLEFAFSDTSRTAVEVSRDGGAPRTVSGSSFSDGGLVSGRQYRYSFVAVYTDSAGRTHRSAPTPMQLTPMPKPRPVDISVADNGDKVSISWTQPSVGRLVIYWSATPFKYNRNDLVSIDSLHADSINVAGNSCMVNKDFSGERFFLPVTVQGGVGVAGDMHRIVSLHKVEGVDLSIDGDKVKLRWNWNGCDAVQISYSIDGTVNRQVQVFRSKSPSPLLELSVTPDNKSFSAEISALVVADGKELVSDSVRKVLTLKAAKVKFESVANLKKMMFLPSDKYEITLSADSLLPCDLHVIVGEGESPTNLVNYSPAAVIPASSVPVGPSKFTFSYSRRNKSVPLYFRIIAADRSMAKRLRVVPESKSI